MASNLVGPICIGQHSVCILRVAALDTDCSPLQGTNGGIVTLGLVSLTADPEVREGRRFEPTNGCGDTAWIFEEEDRVLRYSLSGELTYHDLELKQMLFGGTLINGAAGGPFVGKVAGYAERDYSDTAARNGVYLEVIVRAASAVSGDCAVGATTTAYAVGYIFGKAKLRPGTRTFENAESVVTFEGVSTSNPNLFNGPWNDYPLTGYIPKSPVVEAHYSQSQYATIAATASCGFLNLPASS